MQIPGHTRGDLLMNMRNINGSTDPGYGCGGAANGMCRITAQSTCVPATAGSSAKVMRTLLTQHTCDAQGRRCELDRRENAAVAARSKVAHCLCLILQSRTQFYQWLPMAAGSHWA